VGVNEWIRITTKTTVKKADKKYFDFALGDLSLLTLYVL